MPSSTSFTLPDPSDSHTLQDNLLDESDLEDLYESRHPRSLSSKDYWYGKKLFTSILAGILVENAAPMQSSDDLDVGTFSSRVLHLLIMDKAALITMITEFPYQNRFRQMAQISPLVRYSVREEDPCANFQSFVTQLGKLYRLSDTGTVSYTHLTLPTKRIV